MRKLLYTILGFTLMLQIQAQQHSITVPGSEVIPGRINGTLDDLTDFAQRIEVPFMMPDSTILRTDVFLPIFQDSLAFEFQIPIVNQNVKLVVIPKGYQYIRYDSINGQKNPNPYQLPMIMSRTPYNKSDPTQGSAVALLGYVAINQDMRGRYRSDGVYMPIYSDSWNKNAYHPSYGHVLDLTPLDHPKNANKHEDGYNTVEFVKNHLKRAYDLNGDGIPETEDLVYNGSIGQFGASALAYNQVQAAAAHRIDPTKPGMKSLFPIVGPLEFYKSTGYQNGCFRELLVCGWLRGQIADTRDDLMDIDDDIFNNIHTSFDYGTVDKFEAANKSIDHFSTVRYLNGPAGYYPNSIGRKDMDGSRAPVNEFGESVDPLTQQPLPNLNYSRYTNMEVPSFHVGGWWDIFVDGTFETFNLQRQHMNPLYGNRDKIKVIMGPWAHQTIASTKTGDMEYPKNVTDITKIDISSFDENINIAEVAKSELLGWFRYTLNYNDLTNTGEPTIVIPQSNVNQQILPGVSLRFPAREYTMKHVDLINFLAGAAGLRGIPVELRLGTIPIRFNLNIPKLPPLLPGFESDVIERIEVADFTKIAPVRFYVVGPSPTLDPANADVGNYWFEADTFPIQDNITWRSLYFRGGGKLSASAPTTDEGVGVFIHDPDNPVYTVGGANMLAKTPQGDRDSQGQMKYNSPLFAPFTMDREGVIKFETDVLADTMCFIGHVKGKIYARTNPAGAANGDPTDTDFYIRILDVYPNGDEYYVVEGCVNARAREWARLYADDIEDDNAPYSNIETGKIYEYYFKFLPIAYTFGVGHKIKVLISSSNNPRYQSNPNLPINDGEFFRRQPGDGKTYVFQGVEMTPRKAVQRVSFSPEYPSQIIFPVYGQTTVVSTNNNVKVDWDLNIFPNPSNGKFNVFVSKPGNYIASIFNAMGQQIQTVNFFDQLNMDLSKYSSGQYFIEVQDRNNPASKLTKAVSIM